MRYLGCMFSDGCPGRVPWRKVQHWSPRWMLSDVCPGQTVSDVCPGWVLWMCVPDGCPGWVHWMGALNGCLGWVLCMGVPDGCPGRKCPEWVSREAHKHRPCFTTQHGRARAISSAPSDLKSWDGLLVQVCPRDGQILGRQDQVVTLLDLRVSSKRSLNHFKSRPS